MDIKYSILLIAAINLVIGFFILLKGKKGKISTIFAFVAFIFSGWAISMFFYVHPYIYSSIFWIKLVYFFAILLIGVWNYFFSIFPVPHKTRQSFYVFYFLAASIFFYVLFFTDLWVVDVVNKSWGPDTILGPAYKYFGIFILIAIIWITYFFRQGLKKAMGAVRMQLLYIFAGMISFATFATIFDVIIPLTTKNSSFFWVSTYFSLLFVGTSAYAIVRHRLMDLKLVMRRSTVYLSSIIVIILPAFGALYYIDKTYPDFLIPTSIAIVILGISISPPIRKFSYHLANKYFFSSLYDSRQVIADLSDNLRSTLQVDKICEFIGDVIIDSFHVKAVRILSFDGKKKDYVVRYSRGFEVDSQTMFENDKRLEETFSKKNKIIVVEELKHEASAEEKSFIDFLDKLKVSVIVPMSIKDENLAMIVLGAKESNDMYNEEDLQTFEVIASQSAIAIKNAQLYEETKNFSLTLQQEVDRQTAELQKAYEELKVLDKAKSEFISMASHQLRTPLSAIKGYISMLVEGSYGEISEKAREKLKNVFQSNERLIRIVNDLLDISKIEMGKMELEKAPVQIEDLILSCYEEMKIGAEKKSLKFILKKPKTPLPKVEIDSLKMRQVFLNLIDNAIKYTQKGKIEIEIEKTDSRISVSVKDTGEGLSEKEKRDVFEGFTRGSAGIAYFVEGAGLGLYVAKKFLELQKGKIWVESEGKGEGSTFYVELPIK